MELSTIWMCEIDRLCTLRSRSYVPGFLMNTPPIFRRSIQYHVQNTDRHPKVMRPLLGTVHHMASLFRAERSLASSA